MASTTTQLPPRDAAVEPEAESRVRHPHRRRSKLFVWAFLLLALLVAAAAAVGANTGRVDLDWAFGSRQTSLAWIILAAAGLGWLLGLTTFAAFRRRA